MSEVQTPSLSEIALAYDWSPITRPTVELVTLHLPTSVPTPVTRDDVLSRIAAQDEDKAKAVETYRKAIAAVLKAQEAAKVARASLETKAGNLDEIGKVILAERNKETTASRSIVNDKAHFLTQLVKAVPLDDAEVNAIEAFVTAVKAKVSAHSPLAGNKSEVSTARAKLRAAGYAVGDRGIISPELMTIANSL